MNRKSLLICALAVVCLAAVPVLRAQVAPAMERPNFELYGGYSFLVNQNYATLQHPTSGGMNGWDGSLRVPAPFFSSWLGIKGDVSGHFSNNSADFNPHEYFFLLGPQVSMHLRKSTVFLHGMVGSAHLASSALPDLKSDNTIAVAVGGGLDLGISHHFAWRLTGDWYNTHYQATDRNVAEITNSNGRFSTGPVFRF